MDNLDLSILELLCQNCRLAHSLMAEALEVSQATISNRIKALEKKGVIRDYVVTLDLRPLGFRRHHLLLRFQGRGTNVHSICRNLAKAPAALWIPSYLGAYDAQVVLHAHPKASINDVTKEVLALCSNEISDYAIYSDDTNLQFTNLVPVLNKRPKIALRDDSSFANKLMTRSFPAPKTYQSFSPSRLDLEILKLLSNKPCISLSTMGKKLNCDRQTVKRHISALIKAKIILNFGISIDHSALGYSAYHLLFRLEQGLAQDLIKKTFFSLPNIFYANTVLGEWNLSAYLYAQNPNELSDSIQKIRNAFGEYIIAYDLLIFDKVHYSKHFCPATHRILRESF